MAEWQRAGSSSCRHTLQRVHRAPPISLRGSSLWHFSSSVSNEMVADTQRWWLRLCNQSKHARLAGSVNQGAGGLHTRPAGNVFGSLVEKQKQKQKQRLTAKVKDIEAVRARHYSSIANKQVSLAASALLLMSRFLIQVTFSQQLLASQIKFWTICRFSSLLYLFLFGDTYVPT